MRPILLAIVLDGALAENEWRLLEAAKRSPRGSEDFWRSALDPARMAQDPFIVSAHRALERLATLKTEVELVVLTTRTEEQKERTLAWAEERGLAPFVSSWYFKADQYDRSDRFLAETLVAIVKESRDAYSAVMLVSSFTPYTDVMVKRWGKQPHPFFVFETVNEAVQEIERQEAE